MNKNEYILKLKSLRSIIQNRLYDITTQEDFKGIKDHIGSKIYPIIEYMLKERTKIILGKDTNLKVKDFMRIVSEDEWSPAVVKARIEYYYKETSHTRKFKNLTPDETKRKNKLMKYIEAYEKLQDKIRQANDAYVKAIDARDNGKKDNTISREKLRKESDFINKNIELLSVKGKRYYYLAMSALAISLIFILIFAYDAYKGIKSAFEEFLKLNNTFGNKLIAILKGLIWCSLILVPIAITIFFFIEYFRCRYESKILSERTDTIQDLLNRSYNLDQSYDKLVEKCRNTIVVLRQAMEKLINSHEELYVR